MSRRIAKIALLPGLLCLAAAIATPANAKADEIGYLVNVAVRPGYNFANADSALAYGFGICQRVDEGTSYTQNLATVRADLDTDDDYQAAYLINQAVGELCPALIWQLRRSAGNRIADTTTRS